MDKKRYILVLKMIIFAVEEDVFKDNINVERIIAHSIQYGKHFSVTKDEVEYVLNNKLIDVI